jgi:hypothetical protein
MFNAEMVNGIPGLSEVAVFRVIVPDSLEKSKRFYICAPFANKKYPEEW